MKDRLHAWRVRLPDARTWQTTELTLSEASDERTRHDAPRLELLVR